MTPLEALQATLAGEHAAVYVYGVLGGRVSASAQPDLWGRVRTAYSVHRGRRDQLVAMVRAAGEDPVAAEVSYELPNAARSAPQLTRAARELELRSCAVYADMVGSTAGANRQWAIDAVTDAGVRALGFGAEPEAFPGIAEL
ncbi:MAG: ferritin-like domain-containing protein [Nocardioidaceae bacterium]